jgi:hypothetical protein
MDAGTTYRDESSTSIKYEYYGALGFGEDNSSGKDPLFYKDYVVFVTDSGEFKPYVCKQTFYCTVNITSGNLKDYEDSELFIGKTFTGTSDNVKTIDAKFSDVFEKASNLGNSFFQTLSAISGDIRQLSSSILRIHG